MEIRIRVANPAGNITIFVMDRVKTEAYSAIARQLLKREELHAEQVGFVETKEGQGMHMQMMGGEFCGNATRSFGYLLSMLSKDKPKEVMVDVSGSEKVLKAEVDLEEGTSRVEMPVPLDIKEIHLGEEGVYPVVVFEGICHMIVESEPGDQEFVNRLMKKAEQICPCDAYGVMFLQGKNMVPVVYVKETDSMVWESSCGSGSMGAAVYLSQAKENGWYICELHQPGGVIEVSVCREQGKVTACKMGGSVTISEEMKVEVNI